MKGTRDTSHFALPVLTGSRWHAFTLIEMLVVIVIMGIIAVSVVPAVTSAGEARAAGAAQEIDRTLQLARARAMATSVPHGVSIHTAPSSVQMCWRNPTSGSLEPALASDGAPWPAQLLSSRFGNVRVTSVEIEGVASDLGTIWFAFDGSPELRDSAATRLDAASQDGIVTLSDGSTITVIAGTGAVVVHIGGAP